MSLEWKDLPIPEDDRETLRTKLAGKEPSHVVALAKGAPDLLARVIPSTSVEKISSAFPGPNPKLQALQNLDSSKFSLGARLSKAPTFGDEKTFRTERDKLVSELGKATSMTEKEQLGKALTDLYTRRSA